MFTPLILIVIMSFAVLGMVIGVLVNYRRCPSDKIMVIYGKIGGSQSAECIHGGAAFVWPILQEYQYLDLTPLGFSVELPNAVCKDKVRVHIMLNVTVAISTDCIVMQMAAERLLGLDRDTIKTLAGDIVTGQLRLTIAQMEAEDLHVQREMVVEEICKNVEIELKKLGLKLVNVDFDYDPVEGANVGASSASHRIELEKAKESGLMPLGPSECLVFVKLNGAEPDALSMKHALMANGMDVVGISVWHA